MSKIKIEFIVDNAAFKDAEGNTSFDAIADQIQKVADKVRDRYGSGKIVDVNGNKVGWFEKQVEYDSCPECNSGFFQCGVCSTCGYKEK